MGTIAFHLVDRNGRPIGEPLSVDSSAPENTIATWIDFVPGTPLLLVQTQGSPPDLRFFDLEQRRQVFTDFKASVNQLTMSRDGRRSHTNIRRR
jgi:hypothetical protein